MVQWKARRMSRKAEGCSLDINRYDFFVCVTFGLGCEVNGKE
jgi:hypothetical protein